MKFVVINYLFQSDGSFRTIKSYHQQLPKRKGQHYFKYFFSIYRFLFLIQVFSKYQIWLWETSMVTQNKCTIKSKQTSNLRRSLILQTYPPLTHMPPMHPFPNPWKHQKTNRFSDVFWGQRKGALATNGLKDFCKKTVCEHIAKPNMEKSFLTSLNIFLLVLLSLPGNFLWNLSKLINNMAIAIFHVLGVAIIVCFYIVPVTISRKINLKVSSCH